MAAAVPASDGPPGSGDVPTILVAEDEESVRSMIALVLRSRGYRTILCADGRDAVTQIETGVHIDAVLMDIRMPRLGGIELVTFIRQQPRLASLPVVAMSAYNDQRQEREVLSAGADVFLAKPFTVSDLSEALEALLGPRSRS